MSTRPLIKESLSILNFCGLNPLKSSIWRRMPPVIIIVFYIYFLMEVVLQLVFGWGSLDTVDGLTALGMIYQIISKILALLMKRKKLVSILYKYKQFWATDQHTTRLQYEIMGIMVSAKKCVKMFIVTISIAVAGYLLKPCFMPVKTLPIETYHPKDRNKFPSYELMYTFQLVCFLSGCTYMVGFDFLLISFIIHAICELKAIKEKFLLLSIAITDQRCVDDVIPLINQHNLVLECIKELNEIYSNMLMIQFSASTVCVNGAIVSIVVTGFPPDIQDLVKYIGYLSTVFGQLLIYCIAGSWLTAESESLSQAAYESPWWVKTQPKFRRALSLIIQRSNKTERLMAGGMLTLNLETFTSVVRMCLSFLTLVQAVYTRSK